MSIEDFFKKYNNQLLDDDGYYGGQCMDVYQRYTKEVLKLQEIRVPAAADVWTNFPDGYEQIVNTPTNNPQEGDVVIWGKSDSLPYGHIAVCSTGDKDSFTSFDQNWPLGSSCHYQTHNYLDVVGWLRPKSGIIKPMNDQTIIPKELLAEDQDLEIQQIRGLLQDGKRDNVDLQNCRNENEELKQTVQSLQNVPNSCDLSQAGIQDLLVAAIKKIFSK